MRRVLAVTLFAVLTLPSSAQAVTVYGASSLRDVLPRIDNRPRFSFAGSNQLQRQIAQGAPADLLLAASPREPRALAAGGRCERPVLFATNTLVLVLPKSNRARVRSVYDLARGKRKRVAVGSAGVPVGDYTRTALARLGIGSVLTRNTVSSEPNVASIVAKVRLGSADAGFVYLSDFRADRNALGSLRLPSKGLPAVRYEACVVRRRGADRAGARAFLGRVLSPRGRRLLAAAGFGVPRR